MLLKPHRSKRLWLGFSQNKVFLEFINGKLSIYEHVLAISEYITANYLDISMS